MTNSQSRILGNECSICLRGILMDEERTTACNHVFHASCLETWLNRNPTCPLCRAHLPRPVDDDETDASEDEGMGEDEFDVFFYSPAEMLALYFFFQGIMFSRFPNSGITTIRRVVPGVFQMMMDVVSQDDFNRLIDDHEGWERQEVMARFLEGAYDNAIAVRAYVYDAEFDPSVHRLIAIYDAFMLYTGIRGDGFTMFEAFLTGLNDHDQYLLFRTPNYQSILRNAGQRRN